MHVEKSVLDKEWIRMWPWKEQTFGRRVPSKALSFVAEEAGKVEGSVVDPAGLLWTNKLCSSKVNRQRTYQLTSRTSIRE